MKESISAANEGGNVVSHRAMEGFLLLKTYLP